MANFRIYNDTLCPDLWDTAQHLDPKIRVNLLQLAYDFYEKTKLPAPIVDVYLMGSGANYNWTPDSDIDVHVIIDYSKLQMPPETAAKTVKTAGAQWNLEHNVFEKKHKVEMNLQNVAEQKLYVTGIYSLTKDQWIRKPFKLPIQINKEVLKFQYESMKRYVQNSISSGDQEQMKAAKKYLDAYRQYGLDTYGELSYENIIYKMLRAKGHIKQLKDSIIQVYDKSMTVDEIDDPDINRIHHFDQMQGAIQSKVDKGMEIWKQSGLKVGEVLYTPKGLPVTISGAGVRVDKKGEPLIYVTYDDGADVVETSMYLNKLSYDNPKEVDEIGTKDITQNLLRHTDVNFKSAYDPSMRDYDISKMTLGNLQAQLVKSRRSVIAMENNPKWRNYPDWIAAEKDLIRKYSAEIKRRMSYINAPVNESPMMTLKGKEAFAGDKPLKQSDVNEVFGNIVVIRQGQKGGFIQEGWTLVYFMDSEESAQAISQGKIPYLMVPRGTFHSGGSPITDIWKKKFQKPGTEHILGVIEGNSMHGKIYIDMITVRPGWKRNHIAKLMLDRLKKSFPDAIIATSSRTDNGEKFFKGYGINENTPESSDYNVAEDYLERHDRQICEIADFLKTHPESKKVPWTTVSASLLKRVWLLFGKYHRIHENALDKIADQLLTNIVRLDVSNQFQGHSTNSHLREEIVDLCGIEFTDKEWDDNVWRFCDKNGNDYISDYGIAPLRNIYVLIFNAQTPEEKLYACDKALNVVHQRGDLAEMFVEGGIKTLNDVQAQGGYSANYDYGQVNRDYRDDREGLREGVGGIPEKDRLKIKNTDGSVRRWQIRSKDAPKTPKFTGEEVIAVPKFDKPQDVNEDIDPSFFNDKLLNIVKGMVPKPRDNPLIHQPSSDRTDPFTSEEDSFDPKVKNVLTIARRILDKKTATRPFFEEDYVEDLIGDIMSMEHPNANLHELSDFIQSIVKWLAKEYDIRYKGKRIGE